MDEFAEYGEGAMYSTIGAGALGGYTGFNMSTTKVYRSVSDAKAQDIKKTRKINLAPGGMESKQFGFNKSETQQFGSMVGQNKIASARVPNSMINSLYTGGVDTNIFRSGTLTVYGDQLDAFNNSIIGIIKLSK